MLIIIKCNNLFFILNRTRNMCLGLYLTIRNDLNHLLSNILLSGESFNDFGYFFPFRAISGI